MVVDVIRRDHFVKRYTSVHQQRFIAFLHMPIHIGIDKAENYGFIAHQRLVVTFGVTDSFFTQTAVNHLPIDMPRHPIFIFDFFDIFYPKIGQAHCHAVIKPIPPSSNDTANSGSPLISSAMVMAYGLTS